MPRNRRWPALALLLLLTARGPAAAPARNAAQVKKALVRSLIFPGLGQLGEKQVAKGMVFVSAELFCLIEVFLKNHRGDDAYGHYRSASNANDAVYYRRLTETYDRERNTYLLAAAGVWVLNLVDMAVWARKQKRLRPQVVIDHEQKKVALGLRLDF